MNNNTIRIGTRDSQLAVWQASLVQSQLKAHGIDAELVPLKSDGDIDLVTPLYAMGVQGVFTKTLDSALLSGRFDIAVHSMKDVPIQMAQGIVEAAVLPRANFMDILVPKNGTEFLSDPAHAALIATSSIRRKAQWLHRYPHHRITNLRGNVNTRLRKLEEENWDGAIFAAAGLERINLRPASAIELDWMLPAPAQGAILPRCMFQTARSGHSALHKNRTRFPQNADGRLFHSDQRAGRNHSRC
jgi:hydroxymethylbilane synthase